MDFTTHLENTINKINAFGNITLQTSKAPPAANELILQVADILKTQLNQDIISYYSEMNGFNINWEAGNGIYPSPSGALKISSLEMAIGGKYQKLKSNNHTTAHEGVLWNDSTPRSLIKTLKTHKLVETVFGMNFAATFDYTIQTSKTPIFLVYENAIYDSGLTFSQYIKYSLDALAIVAARMALLQEDKVHAITNEVDLLLYENTLKCSFTAELVKYFKIPR